MATSRWAQALIAVFPNLSGEDFEIVDQPSDAYNCIAYAANDTGQRWDPNTGDYWPPWVPGNNLMDSLKQVFAGLGYEECEDSRLEDGYLKVALYEEQGEAKHAAVQMPNGHWRSKLGYGPLIEHRSPESLSGGMYGEATVFMRRPL